VCRSLRLTWTCRCSELRVLSSPRRRRPHASRAPAATCSRSLAECRRCRHESSTGGITGLDRGAWTSKRSEGTRPHHHTVSVAHALNPHTVKSCDSRAPQVGAPAGTEAAALPAGVVVQQKLGRTTSPETSRKVDDLARVLRATTRHRRPTELNNRSARLRGPRCPSSGGATHTPACYTSVQMLRRPCAGSLRTT
jgi:hypothetical protein